MCRNKKSDIHTIIRMHFDGIALTLKVRAHLQYLNIISWENTDIDSQSSTPPVGVHYRFIRDRCLAQDKEKKLTNRLRETHILTVFYYIDRVPELERQLAFLLRRKVPLGPHLGNDFE